MQKKLLIALLLIATAATTPAQMMGADMTPKAFHTMIEDDCNLPSGCLDHVDGCLDCIDDWTSYASGSVGIFFNFCKHPNQTAAITESSPIVVKELIKNITIRPLAKNLNILELGSGTGAVTRKIIKTMSQEDHLDAIEFEESYYNNLMTLYPPNYYHAVQFHHADFSQWNPTQADTKYDVIICTIPFTRLPADLLQSMLAKINDLLKKGGSFSYISLIGARTWGAFISHYDEEYLDKMAKFDTWKEENFTEKKETVLRNVPPIWVYHLTKK